MSRRDVSGGDGDSRSSRRDRSPGLRGHTSGSRRDHSPRRGRSPNPPRRNQSPNSRRAWSPKRDGPSSSRRDQSRGSRRDLSPRRDRLWGARGGQPPNARRSQPPNARRDQSPNARRGQSPNARRGQSPNARRGQSPSSRKDPDLTAGMPPRVHCPSCKFSCWSGEELIFHAKIAHKPAEDQEEEPPVNPNPGTIPEHIRYKLLVLNDYVQRRDREPLIGLEYILEYKVESKEKTEVKYLCEICGMDSGVIPIVDHLLGYKHRRNYVNREHPYVLKALYNRKEEDRTMYMRRLAQGIEQEEGLKDFKKDPVVRKVSMMNVKSVEAKQSKRGTRWNPEGDKQMKMEKALELLDALTIDDKAEAVTVKKLLEEVDAEVKIHTDRLREEALFPAKVSMAKDIAKSIIGKAKTRGIPSLLDIKPFEHIMTPNTFGFPWTGAPVPYWSPYAPFFQVPLGPPLVVLNPVPVFQVPMPQGQAPMPAMQQDDQFDEDVQFLKKLVALLSVLPETSEDSFEMDPEFLMLKTLLEDSDDRSPANQLAEEVASLSQDLDNIDDQTLNQLLMMLASESMASTQPSQDISMPMTSMASTISMVNQPTNPYSQVPGLPQNNSMNVEPFLPKPQNNTLTVDSFPPKPQNSPMNMGSPTPKPQSNSMTKDNLLPKPQNHPMKIDLPRNPPNSQINKESLPPKHQNSPMNIDFIPPPRNRPMNVNPFPSKPQRSTLNVDPFLEPQSSARNVDKLIPKPSNIRNQDRGCMDNSGTAVQMNNTAYRQPYMEQRPGQAGAIYSDKGPNYDRLMTGNRIPYDNTDRPVAYGYKSHGSNQALDDLTGKRAPFSGADQRLERERLLDGRYPNFRQESRSHEAIPDHGPRSRTLNDPMWAERDHDLQYGKRARLERDPFTEHQGMHRPMEGAPLDSNMTALSADFLKRIRGKDPIAASAILSKFTDSRSNERFMN